MIREAHIKGSVCVCSECHSVLASNVLALAILIRSCVMNRDVDILVVLLGSVCCRRDYNQGAFGHKVSDAPVIFA